MLQGTTTLDATAVDAAAVDSTERSRHRIRLQQIALEAAADSAECSSI